MAVIINGSSGITNVNGTAAAPAETGTDTDSGIVYGTNTVSLATNGTTAVTVDASQNVGIGTTSPSYKLDVQGTLGAGSTITTGTGVSTGSVNIELGGARTGDGVSFIDFHAVASTDYEARIIRNAAANGTFQFINSGTGELSIQQAGAAPITFQTTATERMRIDSSGNVGIGTTTTLGNSTLNVNAGIVARTAAASGVIPYLQMYNGNATTDLKTWRIGGQTNGNLTFETVNDAYSSASEKMRIDSSGNVGIGTNAPSSATNTNSVAIIPGSGQILYQHLNGTASGSVYSYFIYNGSAIASISQNGTTAVAYNTSSDYRLKENISPITGALSKVAALKPVTYTWKSAPDEVGEGFIAHELAEVCPQAVHGEKDGTETVEIKDEDGNVTGTEVRPVYQGIDTSFLVATLTAAIQELKALTDTQASTITALTARITALENK